jgi:hypothetical protein
MKYPSELIDKARGFLNSRRRAYLTTFGGVSGKAVLEDLAKFCRAHHSTFNPDTHIAARLDGRREVWLRIQVHLKLTDDQLWQLMGRPDLTNK